MPVHGSFRSVSAQKSRGCQLDPELNTFDTIMYIENSIFRYIEQNDTISNTTYFDISKLSIRYPTLNLSIFV